MQPTTPLQLYHHNLKEGLIAPDSMQEEAAKTLDNLYFKIISPAAPAPRRRQILPFRKRNSAKEQAPKGVYIHGGVGRGKSMLMDLFYGCLSDNLLKRRVHFHQFMIETHDYFHQRRRAEDFGDGIDGALPAYACRIAEQVRVLCFDEFHVTDVADAMILGRLFTALFDQGLIVVATSNWAPDRLYEGGLQRDRFLPFIALLKSRMEIVHLDSGIDYRAQLEDTGESYFYPVNDVTKKKADRLFEKLTAGTVPMPETLTVKGREIPVSAAANGTARFTFQQLCEQPHGAEDYIKIAQTYHTVFLENIRKMGYDRRNEAKRLMTLIDALYENGTRLVVTAATTPDKLYYGHDHAFEFDRTISRLQEMQSAEYQAKRR